MGKKIAQIESPGPEEAPRDVLTEILRTGCREILEDALKLEIAEFKEQYRDLRTSDGRQRIVGNGYHRERTVQTGVGEIPARVPRARDRQGEIAFTSKLLPPYLM